MRKRKVGEPRRHVYYHCARQMNKCPEPYISEEKLIKQILRYINFMNIAHPKCLRLNEILKNSVSSYQSIREEILYEQNINPNSTPWDIRDYARYVLTNKDMGNKRELFNLFKFPLFLQNKTITSLRAH